MAPGAEEVTASLFVVPRLRGPVPGDVRVASGERAGSREDRLKAELPTTDPADRT
jgi:hypothetical protein